MSFNSGLRGALHQLDVPDDHVRRPLRPPPRPELLHRCRDQPSKNPPIQDGPRPPERVRVRKPTHHRHRRDHLGRVQQGLRDQDLELQQGAEAQVSNNILIEPLDDQVIWLNLMQADYDPAALVKIG